MSKDLAAELDYQARHAAQVADIRPVLATTLARYRDCPQAELYRKEFVFRLIHELKPRTILDFGCGDGENSVQLGLLGYDVTGFDLSPEYVDIAQRRRAVNHAEERVHFLISAGAELELPENAFDVALVNLVLHHVELRPCLESLRRRVKAGGWLVIVEPVGYSAALQKLRDVTPVEKDISPNERQLNQRDLAIIGEYFEIVRTRHFRLVSRLDRLVPARPAALRDRLEWMLLGLDRLLLALPGMSYFAATVVLLARKRADAQ